MKVSVQVGVVFLLALFGLGAAIKCYSCLGVTGDCPATQDCKEDSCLKLDDKGGQKYRACINYSKCDNANLGLLYPSVSSFSFKCCQTDLCNGAPESAAKSSLIGLMFSLALFFWCIF
ncbi:CD59 glycoprotein-like [Trichomycterus rosablanca]|uniref:CD59 glycoprotein-like n=1 Tax=Trichomycterus rosablanca TaxID=2290929 RepID=UPI002F3594D3